MNQYQRTKSLKEDYFQKIDTARKAYIFGLICADGCNNRRGLAISLKKSDVDLLKKVSIEICGKEQRLLDNKRGSFRFSVSSKKFSKDLTTLGCPPAKSTILKFPRWMPQSLLWHFIRGYFDGDGGVWKGGTFGNTQISIVGTMEFLTEISHHLKYHNIQCSIYKTISPYCFDLRFSKRDSVIKFRDLIYKDAEGLFLERKYVVLKDLNHKLKYSKYTGVTYDRKRAKWKAVIWSNGKPIQLGRFNTEDDAFKNREFYRKAIL